MRKSRFFYCSHRSWKIYSDRKKNAHKWVHVMLFGVNYSTLSRSHRIHAISEEKIYIKSLTLYVRIDEKMNGEWTCSRSAKQILMCGFKLRKIFKLFRMILLLLRVEAGRSPLLMHVEFLIIIKFFLIYVFLVLVLNEFCIATPIYKYNKFPFNFC